MGIMYSSEFNTERIAQAYEVYNITIVLERSNLYSLDNEDYSSLSGVSKEEVYTIPLPVYKDYGVPLSLLIHDLSAVSSTNFTNTQILYKLPKDECYVLAGVYPFEEANEFVNIENCYERVFIKFRYACHKDSKMKEEEKKIKVRRGNERKIGDVIDALIRWRKMYLYGDMGEDGVMIKYTRQEAAKIIGIPKKTLDDYITQIKLGKTYGFDFDVHSQEKIGVLREFIRKVNRTAITQDEFSSD
eukprot:TRINITY_DN1542_c0_g1_i1.p1 TRINITY_DN1542_c0_g1~~TRINITY_DN1542_c0_g1_i1.p1  ORF type:complete len:275 (-),score=69.72 TRINITY_DN1542_c0_g1_i1:128-859(-)